MSLSYNKVKGGKFESDLVEYLRGKFPEYAASIHRMRLSGNKDQGDILASLPFGDRIHHVIIEAKNVQRFELSKFITEVEVEVENWENAVGKDAYGIVIMKRRNQAIGKSFVVMTLDTFSELAQA